MFSESASLLVLVHHLVVEHREVQGKTKSDWVARVQRLRGLAGHLIVLQGAVLDRLNLIWAATFSHVSVVVSDHLVEESLGLVGGGLLHAAFLHSLDNAHALIVELSFDFLLVSSESLVEVGVLRILLDCGDGPDGGSLGSDLVFEPNREQVSLLSGEVLSLLLRDLVQVVDHVVESLSLLGDSGHENVLF